MFVQQERDSKLAILRVCELIERGLLQEMTRNRAFSFLAIALVATFLFAFSALPAAASAGSSDAGAFVSAAAPDGIHAQVTVDPSAPKRNFEEVEDKPWTLLMAKALMPLVLVLMVFVIVWYIWKVARVRATTS